MIHPNDKQNQRKHRKMMRRLETGTLNWRCKWAGKQRNNAPSIVKEQAG